jgi:RNA-directed DNA polymerase
MGHLATITLEQVLDRDNLNAAWQAVKVNKGVAGVDGKTIQATHEHLKRHWPVIREKLEQGSYRPSAVKAVDIPKGNGKRRRLGIPTVLPKKPQDDVTLLLAEHLLKTLP